MVHLVLTWQSLLAALWAPRPGAPPTVAHRVVATFPHDSGAFTQGLQYERNRGTLLESTGLYGASSVRRVELETGRVLQIELLPDDTFGEGLAVCGDACFQLTWRERLCLVHDAATLELRHVHRLPGTMREGWGLTHDEQGSLYASDGSSSLHVLAADTFEHIRTLPVTAAGRPLSRINDLQWVRGEIWANLWHDERIAVIDPRDGKVLRFIDLSRLLTEDERRFLDTDEHVLNGLAYDHDGARIFVTGKCWPRLFQIEIDD